MVTGEGQLNLSTSPGAFQANSPLGTSGSIDPHGKPKSSQTGSPFLVVIDFMRMRVVGGGGGVVCVCGNDLDDVRDLVYRLEDSCWQTKVAYLQQRIRRIHQERNVNSLGLEKDQHFFF